MKKRNDVSLVPALAGLVLWSGVAAGAAGNLSLQSDLGYDSNIHTLSDGVGRQGGMFARIGLDAGAEVTAAGGWTTGVDAGGSALRFGGNDDIGDETRFFLRVGGDSGGKSDEQRLAWALRYRGKDATYVSRFTGDVATYGGTPIGDRYDSGIVDASAEWRLRRTRFGQFALQGSVNSKDYRNDYAGLVNGLGTPIDRLDYLEYGLTPELDVESGDNSVRIRMPVALRSYRDRRTSDANGDPVPGSDLEYRYYGLDLRYRRALSKAHQLTVGGEVEEREDNGDGYSDRRRWSIAGDWRWRPSKGTRVSTSLAWSARTLNNTNASDPTVVDESPDKRGYTFSVDGQTPFPGLAIAGLSLVGEARWESFQNSNDDRYTYSRIETFAGVRMEF